MAIRDGSQTMRILAFIRAEIGAGKPFPTSRQIDMHMGYRSTGANDALIRLSRWGYIRLNDKGDDYRLASEDEWRQYISDLHEYDLAMMRRWPVSLSGFPPAPGKEARNE